ncbi:fibroblast growth factor receptor 3-like [Amphiura filiformis]|uniref:fibroblast growth factor receptor 3-like n=1 Tax=Amphiura filiformis TaxID=82378 RepID=UPI003B2252A2
MVNDYLPNIRVERMEWPAIIPDLKPIEHLTKYIVIFSLLCKLLSLTGEASMSSRDSFHTELDLMKTIGRHRNICSLIATSYNKNESLYVAFDFGSNGDLRSFLRRHRLPSERTNISSLSPARLLHLAMDVAKGLDYLSSIKTVHKNLRAKNVIVCNGLIAKVAGIGLTKQEHTKSWMHYSKQISFRWAAIESWSQNVYSSKSDVWSFGVVLWEIATLGGTPYHAVSNINVLQQRLMDGHRLNKPRNCTEEMQVFI